MKKTLLLAGVASILSFSANAAEFNLMRDWQPYVGAEYVYSNAKLGGKAHAMRKAYNSGAVNIGARMYDYYGLEAFYQQSGGRKKNKDDGAYKSEFLAYGVGIAQNILKLIQNALSSFFIKGRLLCSKLFDRSKIPQPHHISPQGGNQLPQAPCGRLLSIRRKMRRRNRCYRKQKPCFALFLQRQ